MKMVDLFSTQFKFTCLCIAHRQDNYENKLGRKLVMEINQIISLALFKQRNGIITKKVLYNIFNLKKICSYKTLVAGINR